MKVVTQAGTFTRTFDVSHCDAVPGTFTATFKSALSHAKNPDEHRTEFQMCLGREDLEAMHTEIADAIKSATGGSTNEA